MHSNANISQRVTAIVLAIVIGATLGAASFAQAPAAASYAQSPAAGVDKIMQREMQQRRIPGAQVAVVQHGKIVLLRSYGIANLADSIPVNDQTMFSLASCSKAFTGVAVMQLVEDGKVDLSAPVSRYLDSLPAAWQPVTIRQLLTHISGLPDLLRVLDPGTEGMAGIGSEANVWTKVRTLPMDFLTGTQFSYNQTNYALLGKIIDKYSGMPFAQFFRERQFRPAGMTRTGFGDSRDVIPNSAPTYRWVTHLDRELLSKGQYINLGGYSPRVRWTANGVISTAGDLGNWTIALLGGHIFRTRAALTTLWTAARYNDGSPAQWALGWVTKPRPQHSAVIITGGGRTAICVYPDDDMAVIVLTNLSGATPEDFIDELAGNYNPAIPLSDPVTTLRLQLQQRGFDQAIEICRAEKKKNPGFQPGENDLNDWAYRMMSNGQLKEAAAIFQLNTILYPQSWNVYDSYGEVLAKEGDRPAAIKMYQRSIELNPDNNGGKIALQRLQSASAP